VEGPYSANTSCSVLRVAVSVFAETTPSFFANRVFVHGANLIEQDQTFSGRHE